MADGNQFGIPQTASPVEIAGYFAHIDPHFAQASNDDKAAYMSHVTGRSINYVGGQPIDMKSGAGATGVQAPVPNPGEPREAKGQSDYGKWPQSPTQPLQTTKQLAHDIGTTMSLASAIPTMGAGVEAQGAGRLVPFFARMGTGAVGAGAGGALGKYTGKLAGGDTGEAIGELGGGLLGGMAGAGAFGEGNRTIGNPRELPLVGKYLPDLLAKQEIPDYNYAPFPKSEEFYKRQGAALNARKEVPTKGITFSAELPQRPNQAFIPKPGGVPEAPTTSTWHITPEFVTKTTIPGVKEEPAMPVPLRPLVGSEADWKSYDQRMGILRPEASDAGTYHAARGSVKAKTNLQQRIGKKLEK